MTSLLTSHLDQIALCSTSISDLSFPGPKIFASALLNPDHDITSLIRDTEAHERALFHLAPLPLPPKAAKFAASCASNPAGAGRRATVYGGGVGGARAGPKSRAVAAVLGGDLYMRTRGQVRQKGEVDVDLLLEGAEKLGAVYPISGASDKIEQLRRRHQQLSANITHYEARVSRNTQELQLMNRPSSRTAYGREDEDDEMEDEDDEMEDDGEVGDGNITQSVKMTKEDLAREMAEVKELERKRQALESRVTGFESDLKGLA